MMRRRFGLVGAFAVSALFCAAPASATIVWNGQEVPAWPEEALPYVPAGAALAAPNTGLYPHPQGNVFGLTLLVDFSDTPPAFNKEQINNWLNQKGYKEGGLNGSVRDYYFDESNGKVDFQNEIFGFYRAKQPKSHYESTGGYEGSDELFAEIMEYFDPLVDFSKYDNDKDGRTDAISIVYAGKAETWGKGLWPHASGSNLKRDGVTVSRYMMTNLGSSLGIYTFAHEVGHMLFGWPDLYGFGNYCIMGNSSSSTNPVGINDFYRADQGWIDLVDVTKDTNAQLTAKVNGVGFRYQNPKRSQESFFWSNVRSEGRFSTIQGDGLILLHFDKGIGRNDPPNPLSLAVVQADGKKDLDQTMWPSPGSDAKDYFVAGGADEFSEAKFATAKWNDGSSSGLRFYAVSAAGTEMTFKMGDGSVVINPNGGAGGGGAGGSAGGGSGGTSGAPTGGASGSNAGGTGGASAGGMAGAAAGGMPATGGATSTAGASVGGAAGMTTSAGTAGATGMLPGDMPADGGDDGSCACRVGSAGSPGSAGAALAVLIGLTLRRRRR